MCPSLALCGVIVELVSDGVQVCFGRGWARTSVVEAVFMRLWRRPLGIACLRWGFSAEAGVDAATVVEIFHPGGDPGVDPVAGGEGTPVVILGFQRGPKGLGHGVIPAHCGLPHRCGSLGGVHVGGQFLGGEPCSPISMQHDPCGEGATGGGSHIKCGDDQSVCCAARPWCIPGLYARAHRARRTGRPSLGCSADR